MCFLKNLSLFYFLDLLIIITLMPASISNAVEQPKEVTNRLIERTKEAEAHAKEAEAHAKEAEARAKEAEAHAQEVERRSLEKKPLEKVDKPSDTINSERNGKIKIIREVNDKNDWSNKTDPDDNKPMDPYIDPKGLKRRVVNKNIKTDKKTTKIQKSVSKDSTPSRFETMNKSKNRDKYRMGLKLELPIIHPNDTIKITIISGKAESYLLYVESDGSVIIPSIGKLMASGKDTVELAHEIEKYLIKPNYSPVVTVEIDKFN